jgi:hypothetical protein
VKALTVRQPWAWAIAAGHKDVENRTWQTSYRGLLAIHAGRTWAPAEEKRACRELLEDPGVVEPGCYVPDRHLLAEGAIVAVVNLVGICSLGDSARCRCSGWGAIGQHHWRLRNVEALAEPIPWRGAQGLWEIDLPGYEPVDRERARGRVR